MSLLDDLSGCIKCLANILLQLICAAESQMKPHNLVLIQSHAMAKHHKSKPPQNPASRMFTDQSNILHLVRIRRGFDTTKQYSREMRGSGGSHSLVLTWLTASSLRLSTNRRLTLKIKTRHHQHFLTYYFALVLTQPCVRRRAQRTSQKNSLNLVKKKRAELCTSSSEQQQDDLIDKLIKKVLGANLAIERGFSGGYVRIYQVKSKRLTATSTGTWKGQHHWRGSERSSQ